ncbi:protein-lysine N-methyltransferase EEF2KMT-like isoform X2 [Dreissena polymorpha]|nr:protein-lysine N-methyltransferase EEF2KMT-like isoform X2 [Dreissena polymorpha]
MMDQQALLSLTVKSPLCQHCPPSIFYQRSFIKKFLSLLEDYGSEICDDLYDAYTELLQETDAEEEDLCYKTFTLTNNKAVTIKESVNMISFGTTGLSTWQASQHLAEWSIQNKELLSGRHILELGCGLGMLGLAVCQECGVRTYTFTDHSANVLHLVADNIHRNLSGEEDCFDSDVTEEKQPIGTCNSHIASTENDNASRACKRSINIKMHLSKESVMRTSSDAIECTEDDSVEQSAESDCETHSNCNSLLDLEFVLNGPQWHALNKDVYVHTSRDMIQVGRLDWESVTQEDVDKFGPIDVLLAADVVYDVRLIPCLVRVLKLFLSRDPHSHGVPPVAYIAATIRSEDTRDQFLIALSSASLSYMPVEPSSLRLFHYDTSIPIEIIKITV